MIPQSKYILILVLVTLLVAVASIGCNTYHGFGKDVSNTGDAIQGDKK
jgi:predicted small secreted protein